MRRLLLTLFSLFAVAQAHAQAVLLGRVLEKVTCAKDPAQAYALYLPSNYTPQPAWPVIFCFDPGARGLEPVQRFHAAAEKYGYIVAGSNNSRNAVCSRSFAARTRWAWASMCRFAPFYSRACASMTDKKPAS